VPLPKLEAYNIDSTEMLITVGIGPMYDEIMSNIICEKCFQHLVSIDAFRKRCKKAQDDLLAEIQEFDTKLQDVRNLKTEERPWLKREVASDDEETQQQNVLFEVIEEHLDDAIYEDANDDDDNEDESFPNEPFDTNYGIPMEPKAVTINNFHQVIIKDETKPDSMEIYEELQLDNSNDQDFEPMEDDNDDSHDGVENFFSTSEKEVSNPKDVYDITDKKAIITNYERNKFVLRVYECFFCQMVSSRLIIISHFNIFNKLSFYFRNLPERKRTKRIRVR
jgi:hypothetical protein